MCIMCARVYERACVGKVFLCVYVHYYTSPLTYISAQTRNQGRKSDKICTSVCVCMWIYVCFVPTSTFFFFLLLLFYFIFLSFFFFFYFFFVFCVNLSSSYNPTNTASKIFACNARRRQEDWQTDASSHELSDLSTLKSRVPYVFSCTSLAKEVGSRSCPCTHQ